MAQQCGPALGARATGYSSESLLLGAMARRHGRRRMFTERGISLIGKAEGARIFADQLLRSPHDQIRFVVGDDWGE